MVSCTRFPKYNESSWENLCTVHKYAYQKCTSSPWVRQFNIMDTSLSALEGFHCNVVCVVNYLQQFLYNTMIVAFSPSTPRPEPTVVKLLLSLLCCCFVFPSKTIIIFVLKFNHFFILCSTITLQFVALQSIKEYAREYSAVLLYSSQAMKQSRQVGQP